MKPAQRFSRNLLSRRLEHTSAGWTDNLILAPRGPALGGIEKSAGLPPFQQQPRLTPQALPRLDARPHPKVCTRQITSIFQKSFTKRFFLILLKEMLEMERTYVWQECLCAVRMRLFRPGARY